MKAINKHSFIMPVILALILAASPLAGQSIVDDIFNNKLDDLKVKVELLKPDFTKGAYLARYLAKGNYSEAMFDYLASLGAPIEQVPEGGLGPLGYAIVLDNTAAVKRLLAMGANVNAVWTKLESLGWPKKSGWSSALVEPDKRFFDTRTGQYKNETWFKELETHLRTSPLHLAYARNNPQMVDLLLQSGANPLIPVYDFNHSEPGKSKAERFRNTIFDQALGVICTSSAMDSIYDEKKVDSKRKKDLFAGTVYLDVYQPGLLMAVKIYQAAMKLPAESRPAVPANLKGNLNLSLLLGEIRPFQTLLADPETVSLKYLPFSLLAANQAAVDIILKLNRLKITDTPPGFESDACTWAIRHGQAKTLAMVLTMGAELPATIELEGIGTVPVLAYMVASNNADMLEIAMAKTKPEDLSHALRLAGANAAIRNMLIAKGADVHASFPQTAKSDSGSITLLHNLMSEEAGSGNAESIAFYIEKGLSPDAPDERYMPPLVQALAKHNTETVKALLAAKAYPDVLITESHGAVNAVLRQFVGQTATQAARSLANSDWAYKAETENLRIRMVEIAALLQKASESFPRKYSVGDTGPGGGIIFYDKGNNGDGWRYLELAPADLPMTAPWAKVYTASIPDARNPGIGRGDANTAAMIAAFKEIPNAAALATSLDTEAIKGWYLPSAEELKLAYRLKLAGKVAFGTKSYWSSTQTIDGLGISVSMINGQSNRTRVGTDTLLIRPVRKVPEPD